MMLNSAPSALTRGTRPIRQTNLPVSNKQNNADLGGRMQVHTRS